MSLAHSDIEWAKQALADGRSLSFVASVLETTERNARKLAFAANESRARAAHPFQAPELEAEVKPRGQRAAPMAAPMSADRRKRLLRRQFAKHWDMIWFLRSKHMSGRKLREIYGADALIWSVGGGIDVSI